MSVVEKIRLKLGQQVLAVEEILRMNGIEDGEITIVVRSKKGQWVESTEADKRLVTAKGKDD